MIHSFHIKNYRGFKDFTIEPFDRVNLITGSNNVGKTSLLEALYLNLTPGSAFTSNLDTNKPGDSTWLNLFRGFRDFRSRLNYVSRWGWLFYDKDLTKDVELKSSGENGGTQILKMYWRIGDRKDNIPIPKDLPIDELSIFLGTDF